MMRFKLAFATITIVLFAYCRPSSAQTSIWDTITHSINNEWKRIACPMSYQLFQRDLSNQALVSFAGSVFDNVNFYSKIRLRIIKKIEVSDHNQSNVNNRSTHRCDTTFEDYAITDNKFNFSTVISAGLINYRFDLILYNCDSSNNFLINVADSVVCGDVFIVMGQSNAEAESPHEEELLVGLDTTYGNSYCRSFARPHKSISMPILDDCYKFGVSRVSHLPSFPSIEHRMFNVGVWSLYLQGRVARDFGMPTCFINGARGGTGIIRHLPIEPYNSDSLFGNMNYKLFKAGFYGKVKGFVWFQGEDDVKCQTTYTDYLLLFRSLYEGANQYFDHIAKYYIFQIHAGMFDTQNGALYGDSINEALRVLPKFYPDMEVMSTNGVGHQSGLHFDSLGYKRIGERLLRLLSRDWYCVNSNIDNIEPPDIIAVYKNTENSLVLEFNQEVHFDTTIMDKVYIDPRELFVINGIRLNAENIDIVLPGEHENDQNKIIFLPKDSNWGFLGEPSTISFMVASQENDNIYLRNNKEVGCLSFAINKIPYWGKWTFTENYLNYPYSPYSDFIELASGKLNNIQDINLKAFEVFNSGKSCLPSYANIELKAANKIILSPGFYSEIGAKALLTAGTDLYAFTKENDCDYASNTRDEEINIQLLDSDLVSLSGDINFILYPNPFNHNRQIYWQSKGNFSRVIINVFDQTGAKICSYERHNVDFGELISFSVPRGGLYIVSCVFTVNDFTTFEKMKIVAY